LNELLNEIPFSTNYGYNGRSLFVDRNFDHYVKSGAPFQRHVQLSGLHENCLLGVHQSWLDEFNALLK